MKKHKKEDDVLLKAGSNENYWPIAHTIETFPNKLGIVRTIKWRLMDVVGADQRELVRPITKILLLVESNSPTDS